MARISLTEQYDNRDVIAQIHRLEDKIVDTSHLDEQVETNTSNIAANASAIRQNASGIAANASAIRQNASDIAANASAISRNTYDIAANASSIRQNASAIAEKQDALVSGTNIKTINNQSILGSGNIDIQGGAGSVDWGDIGGTLSDQADLDQALAAKQDTLVSGTNLKSVNGISLLGPGNIDVSGGAGTVRWGGIGGEISDQTDLATVFNQLYGEITSVRSEKQNTLISGTNIKTINNQSILGAGNIDIQSAASIAWGDITGDISNQQDLTSALTALITTKQDKLTSGTNIKTINNQSILGSGNIAIQSGGPTKRAISISGTALGNYMDEMSIGDSIFGDILELYLTEGSTFRIIGYTLTKATSTRLALSGVILNTDGLGYSPMISGFLERLIPTSTSWTFGHFGINGVFWEDEFDMVSTSGAATLIKLNAATE